jgi:hypothetical protein
VIGVPVPPQGEIEPLRDIQQGVRITAAVLQQEYLVARVLGEPAGQHAAGGSGADDDVVEVHDHTSCSLFKGLSLGARPVITSESPADLAGGRDAPAGDTAA